MRSQRNRARKTPEPPLDPRPPTSNEGLHPQRCPFHSPLVYKRELAVNGAARHELGGLDVDVPLGLVGVVREGAAHHHQAGQARFFLGGGGGGGGVQLQLAAQPAAHGAGAVQGAVFVRLCGHKRRKERHREVRGDSLDLKPFKCSDKKHTNVEPQWNNVATHSSFQING